MLDLVHEEEQVAQLTGLGFEELLEALDAIDPGNLSDRYSEVTDGYMRLAGKGNRVQQEALALDRSDSALRMLLGERGLLVLAGRLLRIFEAAVIGAAAFGSLKPETRQLLLAQQSLGRASRLAQDGLRGPVPVDAQRVAELARQASAAAAALIHLHAGGGWLAGWSNRAQVAESGLSRLLSDLVERDADHDTWVAAGSMFDPARCSSSGLVERLKVCRQASGLAGCQEIVQTTASRICDLAGLVREGLGA